MPRLSGCVPFIRNRLFNFRSDAFHIIGNIKFKSGIRLLLENHAIPMTSLAVLCRLMTIVQRQKGLPYHKKTATFFFLVL